MQQSSQTHSAAQSATPPPRQEAPANPPQAPAAPAAPAAAEAADQEEIVRMNAQGGE